MKKLLITSAIVIFSAVCLVSAMNIYLSSCGNIGLDGDNSVYNLANNIISAYTGSCMTIIGSGTTLDCHGRYIQAMKGSEIEIVDAKDTTIKNCVLDATDGAESIHQSNSVGTKVINTEIQSYKFIRGDADQIGLVNRADADFIISYLFIGGPAPRCMDSADFNDDGQVDISDAIKILNNCRNGCGGGFVEDIDRTLDKLNCGFYP